MRAILDRIIVKPQELAEKTAGGIFLPDQAKKQLGVKGTVVAIGPGIFDDKGVLRPVDIPVGATIVFAEYAGTKFQCDGEDYIGLPSRDIMAVLDEKQPD